MPVPPQSGWVIGGGFLGSALAVALQVQGHRVLVSDIRNGQDAADPAVLHAALAQGVPQTVFCCQATHGGTAADYRRTYIGVVQALQAVVPSARLVFCSSLGATAPTERAAVLREAEEAVLAADGVVLRMPALYGEGRCELLRRHLAGEPRLGGGDDRVFRYLHRDDAVAALLAVAQQPSGRYAAIGETWTKRELYRCLEGWTGVPAVQESAAPSARAGADPDPLPAPAGWQPQQRLEDFVKQHTR